MAAWHERRCPACGTRVEEIASQCQACGLALGEANWCGRCHAIAPVYEREGKHVCCACGSERALRAGTQVATDGDVLRAFEGGGAWDHWWVGPGVTLALATSMAWLASARLPGAGRVPVAVACCSLAVVVVIYLMFRTRREARLKKQRRHFEIGQRIVGLAFCNDGQLTPDGVAEVLRIPPAEAGAFLQELVATGRATVRSVSSTGEVYHFGEAKPTREVRIRAEE